MSDPIPEGYLIADLTLSSTLTFSCGEGSVEVSLDDGSVKFNNCTPDEAGKAFWESVTRAFPLVAQQIRNDP